MIRSFGDNIYTGKVSIDEAQTDQNNFQENMKEFKNKTKPKKKKERKKEMLLIVQVLFMKVNN